MLFLRKILASTFIIATAMLVLIEPLLGQTLPPIWRRPSYGTVSYPLPDAFRETCDTWDATKWTYEYNRPTVVDGTWLFNFPAGWTGSINARRIKVIGYGNYSVRLKTSGARVSGVNYWIFSYHGPDFTPSHNELDFAEIWGGHATGEYSISFWVNGTTSTGGTGYWFFNTVNEHGINWEDGNWHQFMYIYTSEDLIVTLDSTVIFKWSQKCTDPAALGIPFPQMYFYVGGSGKGTQTSGFSLFIDEIEYQPLVG